MPLKTRPPNLALETGRLCRLRFSPTIVIGRILDIMYEQRDAHSAKHRVICIELQSGQVIQEHPEYVDPIYFTKENLKRSGYPRIIGGAAIKTPALWDCYVRKYGPKESLFHV